MERKEFLTGLESKFANIEFLTNQNRFNLAFANIEKGTEKTKFQLISNFYDIIDFDLPNESLFAFELFTFTFKSLRNAIHCTLKHISERKEFNERTYSNQSNISYIKITDEQKRIKNFNDLLATLTEEEQKFLFEISEKRMKAHGYNEHQFDFFHIHNPEKDSFKEGQTISIIDYFSGYAQQFKIYQITPNGFISIINVNGQLATLNNMMMANLQTDINIDENIEKKLTEAFNKDLEDMRIEREEQLEKAIKKATKQQERLEKEAKKKQEQEERAKKKAEEKEAKAQQKLEEEAKKQKKEATKSKKATTETKTKEASKQEEQPTAKKRPAKKTATATAK